ncbi:hypothetical protein WMF28_30055 [Sorangium sp. So ce590]|uniref:hypothetical protein n=1 Tax=Sorangium sp. So ce590 TaxID=3133317 RepID=UPI003F63AE8A
MDRTLRTIGILASGMAIVAATVLDRPDPLTPLSPVGWLHIGLPLYLYVFSQCWMDEGRARARGARGFGNDQPPGRSPEHDPTSSPPDEPTDGTRPG